MTVEETVARWASTLRWEDVPPRVQQRVTDILLDATASGLAGRSQGLVGRAEAVAAQFAGDGSPAANAFVDAYAITSATVCDVYRPGLCHVTPVVVPVLLAIAAERDATGTDLLAALTVGLEVTVRLSQALDYPAMRAHGWHSPGVVGPVGAAAAGARLLGLDPARTANALAHGAAQSAGTFSGLGTEAVKFNQARAATAGLLAALMGEAGLAASSTWLTHADGGMATAYSDGGDPSLLVAGLGETWELEQISLRRWPAASSVQSLIEACLELAPRVAEIEHVTVELAPDAYLVSGERGWHDSLAAQQSARWVTAAVLHDGEWWLAQSSPARIADPTLGSFASTRVEVTRTDELGSAGVRVTARFTDGSDSVLQLDEAPGDPSRPLGAAQIDDKTRRAARSTGTADELIAACRNLASAQSSAAFLQAFRSAA